MSVTSAQLYFNRYKAENEQVILQLESACLVEGDNAVFLAQQLHQSFVKKGQKQYCAFAQGSSVKDKIEQSATRSEMANTIANRILSELDAETIPPESILVVGFYYYLATDYMLVAMLGVKDSVQLSEAINPQRSQYLDIANIQLAIQADLSELQINPDSSKALAYIKGRVGRKVGDFMALAFEIEEKFDAKQATQKLVENVELFIEQNETDPEKTKAVRDISVEVMKSASQSGEFIQIKELSEEIEEKTGLSGFYDMAAQDEDFNDECPVYLSASKALQKFFGQGGGMSISFNRDLLGEHITFDPVAQTLTFKKIPPNLLDSLKKSLKQD
ncbi:nucleoid-associated protein [Catenovulum sp. 2E275]|uniref:nucleoid-associated protein n=1 Tax=Catenovulum sp. 2E275 TaxID=2980497 RepID=UPI0021D17E59|nr:nucleoid-associated protein [Catenovulum sp. 2E275]MCU4674501.1 nucleoid-associated protein [Catenovulum sp. 2E275]